MYSVNILNKLYQKLFQNVEIFSGKFSAKLSNQKKFLGTRFPGSDTFSTSGYYIPTHAPTPFNCTAVISKISVLPLANQN